MINTDQTSRNIHNELPETDLAGNPRVWGESVDMGCYEFGSVSNENIVQKPEQEILLTNYPNPFNPTTTIQFKVLTAGRVKLEIYNIKGQKVDTLIDAYINNETMKVTWHGTDRSGSKVSSGQYFAKLVIGKDVVAKKLLLLK